MKKHMISLLFLTTLITSTTISAPAAALTLNTDKTNDYTNINDDKSDINNITNISNNNSQNTNVQISTSGSDKIHFISTGKTDAILIESNGRFGLVDSAEDTGTSRTRLPQSEIDAIKDLPGYEKEVVNYLESLGVKELDFAIATHAHSDHIGNFDLIFDKFKVKTLYTKEYKETFVDSDGQVQNIFKHEEEYTWDNQEVYNDMISSAARNNVYIKYLSENSSLEDLIFKFGDFTIDIINNQTYNSNSHRENILLSSENSNSLGVVISKNDKKAFLAGDICNSISEARDDFGNKLFDAVGDEDYLITDERTKDLIKNVDLFKFAHHGINGSYNFLNHINPKISVITGDKPKSNTEGYKTIRELNMKNVYTTHDNSNIVVDFPDSGEIKTSGSKEVVINDGWIENNNNWSYMKDDNLVKGWELLSFNGNKNWYYFDDNNLMVTGWKNIISNDKNNWYYFDKSGKMVTGWQLLSTENGTHWYYFNIDGSMKTGYLYGENEIYYLRENAEDGYPMGSLTEY